MSKASRVDITRGPILKSILIYSLPIMAGSLIQVLFNAADLMVLGNMAGETADIAVASVGATSSIVNLLVTSFVGLSAGVSAVLARCIGQRDEARASRVVSTSVISALALGAILSVVAVLLSGTMLEVTECPEDCFSGAKIYIDIYAIGIPFIMVYNFGAAIIRTSGDTQKPFIYLVVGGVLNVVLNFVFCLILEQKVAAVAIATVASQTLSCVLVVIHLLSMKGPCGISIKKLSFSFKELVGMLKIGGPCAFNSALFSLSNLQMQTELNSYEELAIAGNAAASSIEGFVGAITGGFNAATVPFVGQNIGAGNKERVRRSITCCAVLSFSCALIISLSLFSLAEPLLSLYLPEKPEAIEYGIARMKHVLLFYGIAALYNTFVSAMQAFGYSFIPMLNSILTVLVFRIFWLEFIYPPLDAANRSINNLFVCYTFSWTLSLIAHTTMFIIVYTRYSRGKIKKI